MYEQLLHIKMQNYRCNRPWRSVYVFPVRYEHHLHIKKQAIPITGPASRKRPQKENLVPRIITGPLSTKTKKKTWLRVLNDIYQSFTEMQVTGPSSRHRRRPTLESRNCNTKRRKEISGHGPKEGP
jgi:hypothetical protein